MLFFVEMTINRLVKKTSGLAIRLSKYSVTFIKDLFFNQSSLKALESTHRTELIYVFCFVYLFNTPKSNRIYHKKKEGKKYQREQTQSTCVRKNNNNKKKEKTAPVYTIIYI
jgi:hypothetical protein